MGEAFAVGTGALAVVSLGIQVVQGIIQYYQVVKGFDEDVNSTLNSLTNLESVLQLLNTTLVRRKFTSDVIQPVEQSITLCQGAVSELEKKLGKIKLSGKPDLISKIHDHGRKAMYPLRASTMVKLKAIVSDFRANLSLALSTLQIHVAGANSDSLDEISNTMKDVNISVEAAKKLLQDEKSQKILRWLSPISFWKKQADTLGRRQEGTAQWLFETEAFKTWEASVGNDLWCYGMPGVGKTVFASSVIDYLEKKYPQKDFAVIYAFCSYKDLATQTVSGLMSSLLQQLLFKVDSIPDNIQGLYEENIIKDTPITLSATLELLAAIISKLEKVHVVIDALDECGVSPRRQLVETLKKLRGKAENINLICTSRLSSDIRDMFHTSPSIEIQATATDMQKLIEQHISESTRLSRICKKDESLQAEIVDTVTEKAGRIFLNAELHMRALTRKLTASAIRKALKVLPRDIDDIYSDAMERIRLQDEETSRLAIRVLQWITCAKQQLNVSEIKHAMALMYLEAEETSITDDAIPEIDDLIDTCAGIAIVDSESHVVRLVHITAQRYFDKTKSIHFTNAEINITNDCLKYLLLDMNGSGPCNDSKKLEIRLRENPLMRYASCNWGCHARLVNETTVTDKIIEFLHDQKKLSSSAEILFSVQALGDSGLSRAVDVVSYFGLKDILVRLLDEGMTANSQNGVCRTPLSYAVEMGHLCIAEKLLQRNVDVDVPDIRGRTPLWFATSLGMVELSRLLRRHGANPNFTGNEWELTPFLCAVARGQIGVTELLLQDGADLACTDKDGRTALSLAAKYGHEALTRLLLDWKMDPNSEDDIGRTPLSYASETGNEAIVRMLLDEGARIEGRKSSKQEKVEYDLYDLIEDGPKLYIIEPTFIGSTLITMSETTMIQLEIFRGDIVTVDNGCKQIVLVAIKDDYIGDKYVGIYEEDCRNLGSCNGEIVALKPFPDIPYANRMSIRPVVDSINDVSNYAVTDIVKPYFQEAYRPVMQGDYFAVNHLGTTHHFKIVSLEPSDRAVITNDTPIIWDGDIIQVEEWRSWLVTNRIGSGESALHWAAENNHDNVVRLLLGTGKVSIDVRENFDRTPLIVAARNGHFRTVQVLLTKGASTQLMDKFGQTALLFARSRGHSKIIDLLLLFSSWIV